MNDSSLGKKLLDVKILMAKTLRLYFLTNSIVEKEELQLKYAELEKLSKQYPEDSLSAEEQAYLRRLAQYTDRYEEYHTTHSIVRKAEIEEIFINKAEENEEL